MATDTTDFILYTVYNRPKKEKTPGESRFAMLYDRQGKNIKFVSTKILPSDAKSLKMKIKRPNVIFYAMFHCLDSNYIPLDPVKYGWKIENQKLVPVWFEVNRLPSDEEYNEHLKQIAKNETSMENRHPPCYENIDIDEDEDDYDDNLFVYPIFETDDR